MPWFDAKGQKNYLRPLANSEIMREYWHTELPLS